MSFFSALRNWLYHRILHLYYWLQVRVARKAMQLKRSNCSLIDAEIRLLKSDLLQLGEDEELDLLVEYIARQRTGRELLPELEAMKGNARAIDLLEASEKSEAIRNVVVRYHLADAFLAALLNDDARKDAQIKIVRLSAPGQPEYNAHDIYREHAKTVARLKEIRKILAERSAIKMEFSISAISGGVALASAIIVVAGFLYVRYFYQRMGVDVSLYFSVGDYLAASIEQIRYGAFASAISLGTFALGVRAGSLRSRLHIMANASARRREGWIIVFVTLIVLCISAYSIYFGKPEFSLLRMTGFLLSYYAAAYISRAFFKNRIAAMAAIIGTLVFFANVAVSAYERSEHLLTGHNDSAYNQAVHFKEESPQVSGQLFGANGSYYFVYSRDNKVTYVVPRERVAQIDITKLGQ